MDASLSHLAVHRKITWKRNFKGPHSKLVIEVLEACFSTLLTHHLTGQRKVMLHQVLFKTTRNPLVVTSKLVVKISNSWLKHLLDRLFNRYLTTKQDSLQQTSSNTWRQTTSDWTTPKQLIQTTTRHLIRECIKHLKTLNNSEASWITKEQTIWEKITLTLKCLDRKLES